MRLGSAGLARHRQSPTYRAGRARRGTRALTVLAQRVRKRVRESVGDCQVAWLTFERHLVAIAVEYLVDRAGRAPHAAGGQRCRHIRQFERVELEWTQSERPDVLSLDEVGQAFVAFG